MRIIIAGWPRAGKSTLARTVLNSMNRRGYVVPLFATDTLTSLGWSEVSNYIANVWFAMRGPWVVEGTRCVHALRKWLAENPTGLPFEAITFVGEPLPSHPLSPKQLGMGKGLTAIWEEIQPELIARGANVIKPADLPQWYLSQKKATL